MHKILKTTSQNIRNRLYLGTQRGNALQVPLGHPEDVDISGQNRAELAVRSAVASVNFFFKWMEISL